MNKPLRSLIFSLLGALAFVSATPSRAQSDDLLARIKSNKEITIATEARYAPFESVENGKIVGYDADLMAYVLKSLPDVKVKQLDLPFQGLLPGLDAKYWLCDPEHNSYGGVYLWRDRAAMEAYRETGLFAQLTNSTHFTQLTVRDFIRERKRRMQGLPPLTPTNG